MGRMDWCEVSERPISCTGDEVRAIFAGVLHELRRAVRPQPTITENGCPRRMYMVPRRAGGGSAVSMTDLIGEYCPYGQPGDRLWVRETWCLRADGYGYRADQDRTNAPRRWGTSTSMPRAACRITLEITRVRVEYPLNAHFEWVISFRRVLP